MPTRMSGSTTDEAETSCMLYGSFVSQLLITILILVSAYAGSGDIGVGQN